ncbi:Protein angel 2 [Bulinus truncatus]|nr:Protein angel 2 [Bulinus truncatus]
MSSKLRKWDQLNQVHGGMEFTLMTYNILAQDYLEQNLHLYSRCEREDLEWNIRGPALIAQIIAHSADVVCLQEVQEDHWLQDMKDPLEKHGYLSVFKSKEGGKPDGCAILYKRDKFHKIKFVPVEFKRGGILDRDNIGIILILKPVPPRGCTVSVPKICVATTHLLFNPKRGDVKLAQVMVFLAEIDKHACIVEDARAHRSEASSACSSSKAENQLSSSARTMSDDPDGQGGHKSKSTYCPIILCGDFNTEPLSDMYKFITSGYLKYERCISKLLCGQREGQTDGWSPELGKELLPRSVDIIESCQYSHIVKNRYKAASPPERNLRKNSGKVFHEMNFNSVYEHFIKDRHGHRLTEISSQHEYVSATVDYIFYSCSRKNRDVKRRSKHSSSSDEPLVLLARYRLLTTRDAHKIGHLPNTVFPSDHFCLIAKFMLN